jgi:hypothetical protein
MLAVRDDHSGFECYAILLCIASNASNRHGALELTNVVHEVVREFVWVCEVACNHMSNQRAMSLEQLSSNHTSKVRP